MKKIIPLGLLIIFLTMTGCNPFYKIFFGVRNPAFETEASIHDWTKKRDFTDVPIYTYSFEAWESKTQLPKNELFIFDKSGNFISYKNPSNLECTGPAELFLLYLDSTQTYSISDKYNLNQITDSLKTLDCKGINYKLREDVNFHILITFAKFPGKFIAKRTVKKWVRALENNKNIKYELILVDFDLQECWTEAQKKYFD